MGYFKPRSRKVARRWEMGPSGEGEPGWGGGRQVSGGSPGTGKGEGAASGASLCRAAASGLTDGAVVRMQTQARAMACE